MRAAPRRGRGVIERLAPTGEGVAHLDGKAIFVEGALPGEEIEFEIFEERPRFARARAGEIRAASPDRRATDDHSRRCGGTDWAHFALAPAREAKRLLFRETLARIGGISAEELGELPMGESPLEYRLRNQFHLQRAGGRLQWGFFQKRSRRVTPLDGCEIVSEPTRGKIGEVAEAAAEHLAEGETATLVTLETAETDAAHRLAWGEGEQLEIRIPRAAFRVSVGSFFQVNRHRIAALHAEIERLAREEGGGAALDAFAGVGFLSHALLSAGHRVTAVEGDPAACRDAAANRLQWGEERRLRLVEARLQEFAASVSETFDLVLADPPRGGLEGCAASLARLSRRSFLYVSCEPATLARDLRTLKAEGFRIRAAFLEDFFPLTHRVEAGVLLRREGAA